ncbi:membrane protein, putative [Babesia bigemina]|uniref:Membrane protein, putative n=1 Tax=Babesia bigemina TaxID=5866 RepID=A0A061D5G4_BABBI|nr:membrane protein, putative [Babesia bigemina]CDR95272.1 membrane protein, putative [Babesia bigemina]|eukprot:XP_012767458.1 membrane protein, putative [Babesia bigemina]
MRLFGSLRRRNICFLVFYLRIINIGCECFNTEVDRSFDSPDILTTRALGAKQWFQSPIKIKCSFQTGFPCTVYPLDYQDASNLTLLCISEKAKNGAVLTLNFSCQNYAPWKRLSNLYCSVYKVSTSTKSLTTFIDLLPGVPEEIALCLHRLEENKEKTVSCKSIKIIFFVEHFAIKGSIYYLLKHTWKQMMQIGNSKHANKKTQIGILKRQTIKQKSDITSTRMEKDVDCVISESSARICDIEVVGNATLSYAFDPIHSLLWIQVSATHYNGTKALLMKIHNRETIHGVKRKIIIFLDGVRLGALPMEIDISKYISDSIEDGRECRSISLSTLNEESGRTNFIQIRLVKGDAINNQMATIHVNSSEARFMKIEGSNYTGLVYERDYSNRKPCLHIIRDMITEMSILINSSKPAVVTLSRTSDKVEAFLNGIKVKSREYPILMGSGKFVVLLRDSYYQKTIRLSYTSVTNYCNISCVTWCFYIYSHLMLGGTSGFVDSLVTYKFSSFLFNMDDVVLWGRFLVRPMLLFVKDMYTTSAFAELLLLNLVGLCCIVAVVTLRCFRVVNIRCRYKKYLSLLGMLCGLICVSVATVHSRVFAEEVGGIYILGYHLPYKFLRLASLAGLITYTASTFWLLFAAVGLSSVHTRISCSQFPHLRQQLMESRKGTAGYEYFIEGGKLYKLYYNLMQSRMPVDDLSSGRNSFEMEVTKVASVTLNGNHSGSMAPLFTINKVFKEYEDMPLTSLITLRDLEAMSLMRKKVRVWCQTKKNGKYINGEDAIDSLYMCMTMVDCCFAIFALMSARILIHGITLVVCHLTFKIAIIMVAFYLRYNQVKYLMHKEAIEESIPLQKMVKGDILLLGLVNKCVRIVVLIVLFVIQNIYKGVKTPTLIAIIKCCLISCAFATNFPDFRVCLSDGFKLLPKAALTCYYYVVSVYRFFKCRYRYKLFCYSKRSEVFRSSVAGKSIGIRSMRSHSSSQAIPVCILDLRVLDQFKNIYRFRRPRIVLKNVFFHPSVIAHFGDFIPTFEINGAEKDGVHNVCGGERTHSEGFPMHNTTELEPKQSPVKSMFDGLETLGYDFGHVLPQQISNVGLIDQKLDGKNHGSLSSALSEERALHIVHDNKTERHGFCFKHRVPLFQRLFAVIEWRPTIQSCISTTLKKCHDTIQDNTSRLVNVYIGIGSLSTVPPARSTDMLNYVKYDSHHNVLTISDHFIIPTEHYTIRGMVRGNHIPISTSIIYHTSCVENGEITFDSIQEIDDKMAIRVTEKPSMESSALLPSDLTIDHNINTNRVKLGNSIFKANRDYIITYQTEALDQHTCFIYIGPAERHFKEIVTPVTMSPQSSYDFVIIDKTGSSHTIYAVKYEQMTNTKHIFGMKSKVINTVEKIELDYPGIGRGHYSGYKFHITDVIDDGYGSDTPSTISRMLRVKPCQYILGDNMSFLVPITVVCRVPSQAEEDTFRVVPHYDVLQRDIECRINDLNIALQVLQFHLKLATSNETYGDKSILQYTENRKQVIQNICRYPEEKDMRQLYSDSCQDPDEIFEKVLASLFYDDALEDFWLQLNNQNHMDNGLLSSLRIILHCCIDQLNEAAGILMQQDALTKDVTLRMEMQKFDSLVSQGMTVEDAKSLLDNSEQFEYFLQIPFVLRLHDIHSRVDVNQEVTRMMYEVKQFCDNSKRPFLHHRSFIRDCLTQQLVSNVNLAEMCEGFSHILLPSTKSADLSVSNIYCFALATSSGNFESNSSALWIPCFISLKKGLLRVDPSDRIKEDERIGNYLESVICSMKCSICTDTIEVAGGLHVSDEQIQVVAHVVECTNTNCKVSEYSIVDNGAVIFRCHRSMKGVWQSISNAFPG